MTNLRGIIYVALGASSYGMLATFVKVANDNGAQVGILTFSQFLIGAIFWLIWSFFSRKNKPVKERVKADKKSIYKLMIFGIPLSMVSIFYYLSIQYVPVTVGIILLMQSIWLGLIYEGITSPKSLTPIKIIGGLIVIVGTLLAVNIFNTFGELRWEGIVLGMSAALSYTIAISATNSVALHLPNVERTKYLVVGGLITLTLFWNIQIIEQFEWEIFIKWGLFLALFGTILPPILFTKGFPITGVGLGSIIAALEIPVSVMSAMIILGEKVQITQWIGVIIILLSVILINYRELRKQNRY